MSTENQTWIAGQFVETASKKMALKGEGQEIVLISGMSLEAMIGDNQVLVGRVGMRDDGIYFLGRMPMFAIPLKALCGARGRVAVAATFKKTA